MPSILSQLSLSYVPAFFIMYVTTWPNVSAPSIAIPVAEFGRLEGLITSAGLKMMLVLV